MSYSRKNLTLFAKSELNKKEDKEVKYIPIKPHAEDQLIEQVIKLPNDSLMFLERPKDSHAKVIAYVEDKKSTSQFTINTECYQAKVINNGQHILTSTSDKAELWDCAKPEKPIATCSVAIVNGMAERIGAIIPCKNYLIFSTRNTNLEPGLELRDAKTLALLDKKPVMSLQYIDIYNEYGLIRAIEEIICIPVFGTRVLCERLYSINDIAVSANNNDFFIATRGGHGFQKWSITKDEKLNFIDKECAEFAIEATAVALSPNGNTMITASHNHLNLDEAGTLKIWQVSHNEKQLISTLKLDGTFGSEILISNNARFLALHDQSVRSIQIFDITDPKNPKKLNEIGKKELGQFGVGDCPCLMNDGRIVTSQYTILFPELVNIVKLSEKIPDQKLSLVKS